MSTLDLPSDIHYFENTNFDAHSINGSHTPAAVTRVFTFTSTSKYIGKFRSRSDKVQLRVRRIMALFNTRIIEGFALWDYHTYFEA